jgi:dihydrofolate synthase/folylpolyglutamate synthase
MRDQKRLIPNPINPAHTVSPPTTAGPSCRQLPPEHWLERLSSGQATHEDLNGYLLSQVDFERLLGSGRLTHGERDFQLEQFRALLDRLGRPQSRIPVIHVAGTKGKGSTCALAASILQAHGLKVGLYTSPHLERYTERIRIGPEEIPPGRLGLLLARLREEMTRSSGGELRPDGWRTLFEQLTAAAFLFFAEEAVDVAVIETGLGGRLDATNVHHQPGPNPVVAVMTAIGLDHMAILGDTPRKIASEKAGIFQAHGAVVIGPQPRAWADQVWESVHERLNALPSQAGHMPRMAGGAGGILPSQPPWNVEEVLPVSNCRPEGWTERARIRIPMPGRPPEEWEVEVGLPGEHQVANARCALAAVLALDTLLIQSGRECGLNLQPEALREGLARVRWPARCEVLNAQRPVVIDGAHCPLSIRATLETLARHGRGAGNGSPVEYTLVLGLMQDKDLGAMMQAMEEGGATWADQPPSHGVWIRRILATQADWPRAMPAELLAQRLREVLPRMVSVLTEPNPETAFRSALEAPGGVVGLGSLYLPGPFRQAYSQFQ